MIPSAVPQPAVARELERKEGRSTSVSFKSSKVKD